MSPSEIEKWENSLVGFTSVYSEYFNAKTELVNNRESIDAIKSKYRDRVIILADSTLRPLIDNGPAYGRIIGDKRYYRIGNSVVLYTNSSQLNAISRISDSKKNSVNTFDCVR